MPRIRRYLVAGLFAALLVIVSPTVGRSNPDPDERIGSVPVAVQHVALEPSGLRDEAAMVLVGTGLLVLAAAVRRAA